MTSSIHLDLDGAWDASGLDFPTLDLRDLGPQIRYFTSPAGLRTLAKRLPADLPPFILYGSGDFHYLSGFFLQRLAAQIPATDEVTVVCFDNHPDWDVRPPRWSCGGWVNRALELPAVRSVHVWGCGNFELTMPARLFANHKALRSENLVIHPWTERQKTIARHRYSFISRDTWKEAFELFAVTLLHKKIYVTVDLDCLSADHAATNWENGLFTPDDVAWAIRLLRQKADLIAGDVCGAYSPPHYSGWFRRLAGWWDHPPLGQVPSEEARLLNTKALEVIWCAWTDQHMPPAPLIVQR